MDLHGATLSEYFSEDFASFDAGMFTRVAKNDRRLLRDLLRKRGVYVRKGRGICISDALQELIQEHRPWPDDEDTSECLVPPGRGNLPSRNSPSTELPRPDSTRPDHRGMRNTAPEESNSNQRSDSSPPHRSNISNLSKTYYNDKDRYSRLPTDNFDRKLCLFNERCDQSSVPENEKKRAVSIMLTGRARDFYFDNLQGKQLAFEEMIMKVKRRFITAEHERTLVREWDSLTLRGIISENAGKPKKYCLEELVSRMHSLQSGLPKAYCNEDIFMNKLLNAVKDVEACQLAYFKPTATVEGLISDLHSSLAIEPQPRQVPALDAHFVDRKYKGQRGRINYRKNATCIVCKKKGCWSTNHSAEERIASLRKNRQVRQFFTAITDEDGDEEPVRL